jgi:hypothetical protein
MQLEAGLSYYASFCPPGETELVDIPRQNKDAAEIMGMKQYLGPWSFWMRVVW